MKLLFVDRVLVLKVGICGCRGRVVLMVFSSVVLVIMIWVEVLRMLVLVKCVLMWNCLVLWIWFEMLLGWLGLV